MQNSNYVVIQGDQVRKIEMSGEKLSSSYKKEFKIEGKDSGGSAIVFVMLKGLVGDAEPVEVHMNGTSIGRLFPNADASPESWHTQILHFSAREGALNPNAKESSEVNTIEIPGPGSPTKFGKFYVQNIVCYYKPLPE